MGQNYGHDNGKLEYTVVLEEQPHEVSHLYMSASAWSLSGVFF